MAQHTYRVLTLLDAKYQTGRGKRQVSLMVFCAPDPTNHYPRNDFYQRYKTKGAIESEIVN